MSEIDALPEELWCIFRLALSGCRLALYAQGLFSHTKTALFQKRSHTCPMKSSVVSLYQMSQRLMHYLRSYGAVLEWP